MNLQKSKGFALTQTVLAIALGSAIVGGVAYHYQGVHYQNGLVADANTIVINAEKSFDAPVKRTWKFTGETFNEGQAFNGTATIDASGKVCTALKARLALFGSVACDTSGTLTFTPSTTKPTIQAGVSEDVAALPSSTPPPVTAPNAVNLDGTAVTVGSSFASNDVANPPIVVSTFSSVSTAGNASRPVDGGNSGGVYSEPRLAPGLVPFPVTGVVGTGVVNPPPPPIVYSSNISCGEFDNNTNAGQGYTPDAGFPKITNPSTNSLNCIRSSMFLYANEPSTPFDYGPSYTVYNIPSGSTIAWNSPSCAPTIVAVAGNNLSICVPAKTTITSALMNAGAQNVTSSATAVLTYADGSSVTYSFNGNYTLHGPGYSATPMPTTPTVLSSMWGVNVVVSQGSNVDHYEMGITCGVSPPQSQFDATVQNVPASGLYSATNTSNLPGLTTGYYFVNVGVPYTVLDTTTAPQIIPMTNALPQSMCNMNNGFGGVFVPQVQVRACNASNQCSAWSPQFGQFCAYNRC